MAYREFEVRLGVYDVRPEMQRLLHNVNISIRNLLDMGVGEEYLYQIAHYSVIMTSMLWGDRDIRDIPRVGMLDFLDPFINETGVGNLCRSIPEDLYLGKEETFTWYDGEEYRMTGWLREKTLSLWEYVESMVENLWVGGLLYGEYADEVSQLLENAYVYASFMGVLEKVGPVLKLDYSDYFRSKYGAYYKVYEEAGAESMFGRLGVKRLNKIALALQERERFFSEMLWKYDEIRDGIDSPLQFSELLDGFEGPDRRVEILKRLTHEDDMVYGGFSTFDPVGVMKYLMDEIRSDFYGGVYVPLGEDEASYRCIVPQLRARWLNRK